MASATANDDEILDTSWLKKFKKTENRYNHFYKEPLTSVRLYLLYIDKNKTLTSVDTIRCALDENNSLKRDRLIALIKYYQLRAGINYKLNSLLRYNIDLNPDEINNYINEVNASGLFLKAEKYLEDIHYNDSIQMFQKLNALYFIYFEDTHASTGQTKKITLTEGKKKTIRNRDIKNLKIAKEISICER